MPIITSSLKCCYSTNLLIIQVRYTWFCSQLFNEDNVEMVSLTHQYVVSVSVSLCWVNNAGSWMGTFSHVATS